MSDVPLNVWMTLALLWATVVTAIWIEVRWPWHPPARPAKVHVHRATRRRA